MLSFFFQKAYFEGPLYAHISKCLYPNNLLTLFSSTFAELISDGGVTFAGEWSLFCGWAFLEHLLESILGAVGEEPFIPHIVDGDLYLQSG